MRPNKFCLLTYTSNEDFFFPIWYDYYSKIFNTKDIFIINNNPKNNLVKNIAKNCNIEIYNTKFSQDLNKIFNYAYKKIKYLLNNYDGIYIAESDEILYHPDGLTNIADYYLERRLESVRAIGYEPIHDFFNNEPDINQKEKILKQRKNWREADWIRKIFFITQPIDFYKNMHNFDENYSMADYKLTNIHLKFIDYKKLKERNSKALQEKFNPKIVKEKIGWQNRIESEKVFEDMFKHAISKSFPIPEKFKNII